MLPLTSMRHLQTENRDLQVHNRDLYPICTKPLLLRSRGLCGPSFLVPVPQVDSLESLNSQLRERCLADLAERSRGKSAPKGQLLLEDQAAFLPLPKQPFEARRVRTQNGRLWMVDSPPVCPRSTYSPSANFLLEAAGKVGIDLPEL